MASKITTKYKYDANWENPHKYTISFNDGLAESEWFITLRDQDLCNYFVFPLSIGLDVTAGQARLTRDSVQKIFGERIDTNALFRMTHVEMIKYITKDLTREIAFDGQYGNFWLPNLNALAKYGLYNFLIESGLTKDDFFAETNSRRLFEALVSEPIIRELIDKLPKNKQPIEGFTIGTKVIAKTKFYGEPKRDWADDLISEKDIGDINEFLPKIVWKKGDEGIIDDVFDECISILMNGNEGITFYLDKAEKFHENFLIKGK
jgi:hypothetical protein